MIKTRGNAMGSEHRDKGVDVQLGPVGKYLPTESTCLLENLPVRLESIFKDLRISLQGPMR
jgi:hypothetical protein